MKSTINPGSRADIEAARGELMAWLDKQIDPEVIRSAMVVAGDLGAALIGARVHPVVLAQLIADVGDLREVRVHGRAAQGR